MLRSSVRSLSSSRAIIRTIQLHSQCAVDPFQVIRAAVSSSYAAPNTSASFIRRTFTASFAKAQETLKSSPNTSFSFVRRTYTAESFAKVQEHIASSGSAANPYVGDRDYKNLDLVTRLKPANISDRVAFAMVKFLRFFADLFFQKRYGHRAVVLETVAGVPGMVAGMVNHLRSLRKLKHDDRHIKTLLEEAENERMHLMTFMEIAKPTAAERALVIFVQGVFFNLYLFAYTFFPKTSHRFVGYLEEEAVVSYTSFLKEIDDGRIENIPAPKIAIDYWQLAPTATLRDVVEATRADEANHRDVNHVLADEILAKRRGEQNTVKFI